MKFVWIISASMTAVGLLFAIGGNALGLSETWQVAGLLLLAAGIVKLVIAAVWAGMFRESALDDRSITNGPRTQ